LQSSNGDLRRFTLLFISHSSSVAAASIRVFREPSLSSPKFSVWNPVKDYPLSAFVDHRTASFPPLSLRAFLALVRRPVGKRFRVDDSVHSSSSGDIPADCGTKKAPGLQKTAKGSGRASIVHAQPFPP
jgi:hypothetical protein